MEKTSKRKLLKNYLLESLDFTGYDNTATTLENAFFTCKNEYGHIQNDHKRTKERLLGLPSCIGVAFSYFDISELMKSFGYKTKNIYKLSDMYRNNLASFIVLRK